MSERFQVSVDVSNGRNPGDVVMLVEDAFGDLCSLSATYYNAHYWLPGAPNLMVREWVDGEPIDDGLPACTCVVPIEVPEYGTCCLINERYVKPSSFIIEVSDGAGSFSGYGNTWSMSGLNGTYNYNINLGGSTLRCDLEPDDIGCKQKGQFDNENVASDSRFVEGYLDMYARREGDVCSVWITVDIRFQADGGNPAKGDTPELRITYETEKVVVSTASEIEDFLRQTHNPSRCKSDYEDDANLVGSGDLVLPSLVVNP